ncbi:MAG: hypothetical protein IPO18_20315 [bacterium]|nr:hypothetical protein [bacterium]
MTAAEHNFWFRAGLATPLGAAVIHRTGGLSATVILPRHLHGPIIAARPAHVGA